MEEQLKKAGDELKAAENKLYLECKAKSCKRIPLSPLQRNGRCNARDYDSDGDESDESDDEDAKDTSPVLSDSSKHAQPPKKRNQEWENDRSGDNGHTTASRSKRRRKEKSQSTGNCHRGSDRVSDHSRRSDSNSDSNSEDSCSGSDNDDSYSYSGSDNGSGSDSDSGSNDNKEVSFARSTSFTFY